jgi:hypothetical protein
MFEMNIDYCEPKELKLMSVSIGKGTNQLNSSAILPQKLQNSKKNFEIP